MNCNNCGNQLKENAVFCNSCGTKTNDAPPMNTNMNNISQNATPANMNNATHGSTYDVQHSGGTVNATDFYSHTNDTICPKCGANECYAQQIQSTEINTKSGFSEACCGAMIFGPIGLLCGFCGKSTSIKQSSETWWFCKKCGNKHFGITDSSSYAYKQMASVFAMLVGGFFLLILSASAGGSVGMFFLLSALVVDGMATYSALSIVSNISNHIGFDIRSSLPATVFNYFRIAVWSSLGVSAFIYLIASIAARA